MVPQRNGNGLTVSVVIPTFNRADIVTKAIDSALAQTRPPDEVIVVDDGSSDDTRDRLKQYGDRIRYIHQDNAGVSIARNTGVLAARGEWIAFLDSDDEWVAEKLAIQLSDLMRHDGLIAHVSDVAIIMSDGRQISPFGVCGRQDVGGASGILARPLADLLTVPFMTPAFVVRRNALIKAGLFDKEMSVYEDQDAFARVALQGPWGISTRQLVHVFLYILLDLLVSPAKCLFEFQLACL